MILENALDDQDGLAKKTSKQETLSQREGNQPRLCVEVGSVRLEQCT